MMHFDAGRLVYLLYDGGDDYYHERLILAHISEDDHAVAAPDYDVLV